MNTEEMNTLAKEILPHYLSCVTRSTVGTDLDGNDLESLEDFDFSDEAEKIAKIDCLYFVSIAHPWFDNLTAEQIGHDFWLTREGHGTGFWDRGFKYGDVLTSICKKVGTRDAYISDAGMIDF